MTDDLKRSGPFGKLAPQPETPPQKSPTDDTWWTSIPNVPPQPTAASTTPSPSPSVWQSGAPTPLGDMRDGQFISPSQFVEDVQNPFHREPTLSDQSPKAADFRSDEPFFPQQPQSLQEAGLSDMEVQSLILKYLLNRGIATGRNISQQIKLNFTLTNEVLQILRRERLVVYRNSNSVNDYDYQLTEYGIKSGQQFYKHNSYYGSAPVPLEDYIASVEVQSPRHLKPGLDSLKRAFRGLVLDDGLLSQIGQALHSGKAMFLFGPPGNGKTTLAEKVTASFGDEIWIPRAIHVNGEILRFFDPNHHQALTVRPNYREGLDERWVRIARPTVIVGGELQRQNLEVTRCAFTGISEAPLQLKSNCGTLVIDDFGRQRISISELLNRWILPLENRYDLLNLASGRKIRVPFDQMIIFSTNLEPRELVEEAFLRRIPYKIEVQNPTEAQYRKLFLETAGLLQFECSEREVEYLLKTHYRPIGRELRFCHVRDLFHQMVNYCSFHKCDRVVTEDKLDLAIKNYFSVI